MNIKEINSLALQICKDRKSVTMSKREFINAFGYEKRTSGNMNHINSWFERLFHFIWLKKI